jgi:hypothetical protein
MNQTQSERRDSTAVTKRHNTHTEVEPLPRTRARGGTYGASKQFARPRLGSPLLSLRVRDRQPSRRHRGEDHSRHLVAGLGRSTERRPGTTRPPPIMTLHICTYGGSSSLRADASDHQLITPVRDSFDAARERCSVRLWGEHGKPGTGNRRWFAIASASSDPGVRCRSGL